MRKKPRLNAAELEIELFCRGLSVDPSCLLEDDARVVARTRAGLGSGLELVIPGRRKNLWMNVPVEEDFARSSPFRLMLEDTTYFIHHEESQERYSVVIPPEPVWYNKKTSEGTLMRQIGVLQGTYLGIYLSNSCGFWHRTPSLNCRFCTTGMNVGVNEVVRKEVEEIVEVCREAKHESGVTFVHFNSGYEGKDGKGLDLVLPYVQAIKEQVGALIGVQMLPATDFQKYDRLIEAGVNHFSFCYEFHNLEYFEKLCPGKAQLFGQASFFRALEYTAEKLGTGAVSGEIIAGVEPIEDTLAAIDYITGVGAFPTVCIFRPLIGADMEHTPPPDPKEMRHVFRYLYEACRKARLPIGIAPNIEVSLIVQPDDAKYLVPHNWRYYWYEGKLRVMRLLAKPRFRRELRPRHAELSPGVRRSGRAAGGPSSP